MAALLFLLLAAAGIPLAMAPGLLLEYEVVPKLVALLIATAGLLCCWKIWYPGALSLLGNTRGRVFAGVLALQVASLAISTVLSPRSELALAGSAWRRYGMVTQAALALFAFLAASCASRRESALRTVFLGMGGAAGLVSVYAILQYSGWDPFLARALYTTQYNGEMVRVPATMGHAVYLGSFLAAAIPMAIWLAGESAGAKRIIFLLIASLSLLALTLSGSRSAVVALAVGLLVSGTGRGRVRISPMAAIAAGFAAIAILVALWTGDLGASFRLRLTQWRQDAYGGPRLRMWRDSMAVVAEHSMLGTGPESFGDQFRRLESAELSRAYPDFFQESPHNLFLAAAVEQGIPGVAVLVILVGLVLTCRPPRDGPGPALKAAAICTFVCLFFLTVTIQGSVMLYLAAGLLVAASTGAGKAVESRPGIGVVTVAIVAALVLVAAAGAYLRQDLAYQRIARASGADVLPAFEELSLRFPASGDDLWCSRQLAGKARATADDLAAPIWAAAAAASARAERTSDDFAGAAFQSALLAIGRNDASTAERKLRECIAAAPNWYRPHLLLAQLIRFAGRTGESDAEARRALDLAGEARAGIEKTLGISAR